MNYQQIKIAPGNTHHLLNGEPLYPKRFLHVMKYHDPGLAPVQDATGAYHIDISGNAIYSKRFQKTFGFYFKRAAVVTETGWCHIDPRGSIVYPQRYTWTGNYQDEACVVRDRENHYFHIDSDGKPLYSEVYLYAGDFRDGIAVVREQNGFCTHITKKGANVHGKHFFDLDVYHKEFARARDAKGWFHIGQQGVPAYKARFAMVEAFYNGFAFSETLRGERVIIDEKGAIVLTIHSPKKTSS